MTSKLTPIAAVSPKSLNKNNQFDQRSVEIITNKYFSFSKNSAQGA
jgi:hypothetical protein